MSRIFLSSCLGCSLVAGFAGQAFAQESALAGGYVVTPRTSLERPQDRGVRAHTNVELFYPNGGLPMTAANTPGGFFETPASLACVYRQVTPVTGCSPAVVTKVAVKGKYVIAIVDAYHDPDARKDLTAYSAEFGLPAPTDKTFKVVYAAEGSSSSTTTPPPEDSSGGWELEESLDIEMAHAMAPKATVILVEAYSSNASDIFPAITLASNLVVAAGGGEVSMSFGFGDFAGESYYDTYFQTSGVVYFASAGDSAGLNYPSTSPYVVSAGGATINRNGTTGDEVAQSAWWSTGGGLTPNESRPSYQDGISSIVGTQRGTPDIAFDANPSTGVWIYDSFPYEGTAGTWYIVGGTSVASPGLAGLVNAAGHFSLSTNEELTEIYLDLGNDAYLHDIAIGDCGPYVGYLATKGWDYCTGVGTVAGIGGK